MLYIGDKIQYLSSKTHQIRENDMYIKTVLAGRLNEGLCTGHLSGATSRHLGSSVMPANSEWPALHRLWPASHRCNLMEAGVKAGHTPLTSCPVVLWHHREREQREPAQDTHVPPGRGSSSYLQGLLSLPQADNPKTNSLRPGMVASSAVCPVSAFPLPHFPPLNPRTCSLAPLSN